ncbi:tetratricopeptide repeat protein [Pseudochelatococcus sp. B33]
MAIRESETHQTAGQERADSSAPDAAQSIREYLGLKVEHLLPGLDIAANHLRRGEHAEALRTYSTLVLMDPTEARFQRGLAECALETGDFHLASLAASSLIAGAPDKPEGYLMSGRAFFGLRDFDAAIEDFREAVRLAEQAGNTALARQAEPLLQRALIAKEVKPKN